jgi:hypothetical protein
MSNTKNISIRQYLKDKGINPVIDRGYYGMYRSPYRKDSNPSFKVDYRQNIWYDFGTNQGGSIIDLVMKMENCPFHEAATKLEKQCAGIDPDSFSFHRGTIPKATKVSDNEPAQTILKAQPISHPALTNFVQERKIGLELANQYCREIHYRVQDRNYFSIGFKNDKGGYELSNAPNFKGCISPKDITTVRNSREACLVFEGFWDFLSYLTLQKIPNTRHDVVILNSVTNVSKAMDYIKAHREIYTYLDNDESGHKTTLLIKSACLSVNDRSAQYAGYKDLNDYLRGKQMVQAKRPIKGFKL